jgi:hypothetical protein
MRDEEFVLSMLAMAGLFAFAWIATRHCAHVLKAWIDIGLKRDMVARGYAAEEIVAVVAADRRCRLRSRMGDVPPAKPIRQPAYSP